MRQCGAGRHGPAWASGLSSDPALLAYDPWVRLAVAILRQAVRDLCQQPYYAYPAATFLRSPWAQHLVDFVGVREEAFAARIAGSLARWDRWESEVVRARDDGDGEGTQ